MAPPERYEPASILHKEGIPCVVWFEDAVAHYGVPTVVFDLHLLVLDIDAAARVLRKHGWTQAEAQSAEYHFLGRYQDIQRCRLDLPVGTAPGTAELGLGSSPPLAPANEPQSPTTTVLLSADDWKYSCEKLASSLKEGPIPQLHDLLDSLIKSVLDWEGHSRLENNVSVYISCLYKYVAQVKEKTFAEGLKYENRQFHYDALAGLAIGTVKFRAHERRVRAELRTGTRHLRDCSLERVPENLEYFSDYVPPALRRTREVQQPDSVLRPARTALLVGVSLTVVLASLLYARYSAPRGLRAFRG
ncbi:hypothetical protein MFIFM68171_08193 [Madurella fahalii]|uniref:Uncharacterized protein n=1 Tax=Madurella fahalii TaxID=1157608 RepID=A0ABQ0GJN7_9PEZI